MVTLQAFALQASFPNSNRSIAGSPGWGRPARCTFRHFPDSLATGGSATFRTTLTSFTIFALRAASNKLTCLHPPSGLPDVSAALGGSIDIHRTSSAGRPGPARPGRSVVSPPSSLTHQIAPADSTRSRLTCPASPPPTTRKTRIPKSSLTRPWIPCRIPIGLLQHSLPARCLLVGCIFQAYARSTPQHSSAREEFRSYAAFKGL